MEPRDVERGTSLSVVVTCHRGELCEQRNRGEREEVERKEPLRLASPLPPRPSAQDDNYPLPSRSHDPVLRVVACSPRPRKVSLPRLVPRRYVPLSSGPSRRSPPSPVPDPYLSTNAAPEIVQLYAVNFPASAVRAKVRQEFERNMLVDDLETVDILLLKGHQEFQEVRGCAWMNWDCKADDSTWLQTVNCWKMER